MSLRDRDVLMRIERLTASRLRTCIDEAWITPVRDETGPLFDEPDVARLQLICELTEDFDVNDAAVPIILSLVDQLHGLERHVRGIEEALAELDEAVLRDVLARLGGRMRRR